MQMDMYGFYMGKIFDAYKFLGAHTGEWGTTFRVFAPNAQSLSVIGDFNNWQETPMNKIHDGNFYECTIPEAKPGMRYKIKVHTRQGGNVDHADPYGYGMEVRPGSCSIIRDLNSYAFGDEAWMNSRTDGKDRPVNIYEVHLGSWRTSSENENGWFTYKEIAKPLVSYVKKNHYNYIEIMPLCEYPADESWGYQALGFYSPTARYGDMDGLKYLVDTCHKNNIGVILDFAPVHFAVDYYGLAQFDGTALYEYPHQDVGYNEWGSKNFMHSRGEVRSFLQSSVMYWLQEYHFDGIRMDAISNMIYWQGNKARGVNNGAVEFIRYMNEQIKKMMPNVMLIAEDSTSFPNVTKKSWENGLGFDYKWDMGWMNDTLAYFKENSDDRIRDYYKLHFSMHYYYTEQFMLPLSHDEVVHGKATILQKMNGDYDMKFPQGRAFYMYMFAHPGKKLNFMGNEIGQLREWDEKREQDWDITKYPIHDAFHKFMTELNKLYLNTPAMYEMDYDPEGFAWVDEKNQPNVVYGFMRKSKKEGQLVFALFNFSNKDIDDYSIYMKYGTKAKLLLDSNWEKFGGTVKKEDGKAVIKDSMLKCSLPAFTGRYYVIS